jgi:hypothetical protein
LDVDEVGDLDDLLELPEVLSDPEVVLDSRHPVFLARLSASGRPGG